MIINVDISVVKPIVAEAFSRAALRLSYLILVVREYEVLTAAVNIYALTQKAHNHCRALYMPAGSAHSPGGPPCGLTGLRSLPEGEVEGVLLYIRDVNASARFEVLDEHTRELSVHTEVILEGDGRNRARLLLYLNTLFCGII